MLSAETKDARGGVPHRYAPIGDYALIGDTSTGALISEGGSLDWLCLPNFDDGSVFGAILDSERGGRFIVSAANVMKTVRCYLGNSAILVSRHETSEGTIEVTDFMPLALPDGFHPQRQVERWVLAVSGRPTVHVVFAPRPHYGRQPVLRQRGQNVWTMATGRESLLLRSQIPLTTKAAGTLEGEVKLDPGEIRKLSLAYTKGGINIIPTFGEGSDKALSTTRAYWENLAARITYRGRFRAEVIRSLITLRLLTFSQSGAVLAAASMGLPEAIGGERNWDYRYCWLRDAAFVLHGFVGFGLQQVAEAFFRWLMHATQLTTPRLKTLYTVYGRTDLAPCRLERFEGYRGSAPVHRGNGAHTQLQLDGYGAILGAARIYAQHGGAIGKSEMRRLKGFADVVRSDWTLPDNGLWEMQGGRMHHTYSKAMCWTALDSFIRIVERQPDGQDLSAYRQERERIQVSVLKNSWNEERGAFTGAYGQKWLDASVLLLPRLGIVPADDPRMASSYEVIQRELGYGCQLRRYAPAHDGFPSAEGTFTACGFWAADYLARCGRVEEAEGRVAELAAYANSLGLLSEQLDPDTGAMLGNFPQAFSHAGLIGAVLAIEEARGRRAS